MSDTEVLDDVYQRLHHAGPEFGGWLSNHGPMAADALIRLGHPEMVDRWINHYLRKLEERPTSHWPIEEAQWREPLGDPSRMGDWIAFFTRQFSQESWEDVLARWWPRLLPGAIAAASHGLIRTGHGVRALREHPSPVRLNEVAQALGYWAARWQTLPQSPPLGGADDLVTAVEAIPYLNREGGIRTRLASLAACQQWPLIVGRLRPVDDFTAVPQALETLVDAAVTHYAYWAHGNPVMLVHAATAPRAASLILPSLPTRLWIETFETTWRLSAALIAIYRPPSSLAPAPEIHTNLPSAAEITEQAIATRDEHAIKFTEVAQESHQRGNSQALSAARRASELLAPQED